MTDEEYIRDLVSSREDWRDQLAAVRKKLQENHLDRYERIAAESEMILLEGRINRSTVHIENFRSFGLRC